MTQVRFNYADPASTGVDRPAQGSLRLALAAPERVNGVLRSQAPFTVPLVNGEATVPLSPGYWRIVPSGVRGAAERWVRVPDSQEMVQESALQEIDPETVQLTPEQLTTWADLARRVDAIAAGGGGAGGGGVKIVRDPQFSGALLLTVTAAPFAPVVTEQPGTKTVAPGLQAVFAASADGEPAPTRQWQRRASSAAPWVDIDGAKARIYTTPALTLADNGSEYRALFTNSVGTTASEIAVLTVVTPVLPVITKQPVSVGVWFGDHATLSAEATGYTSVQWYVRSYNGGSSVWASVPGATTATYNTGDMMNTSQFKAVFTNAAGSTETNVIDVTVVD